MGAMNIRIAAVAVVAATVLVLGWQLKTALRHIGELEAKLAAQVEATNQCADANQTNQTSITELETQLAEIVAQRRIDEEAMMDALVAREREIVNQRNRADRLERERRHEIATNATCAAFMRLSLDAACPDNAQRLRQRTIGEGGNGDEDS